METSPILLQVLQILAGGYGTSFSLEELTKLADSSIKSSNTYTGYLAAERANQALVLDVLLFLQKQGLIFLDFHTDYSVITIKGLLKIHPTVLSN